MNQNFTLIGERGGLLFFEVKQGWDAHECSLVHIVAPSKVVLLVHIRGRPPNYLDYTGNRL